MVWFREVYLEVSFIFEGRIAMNTFEKKKKTLKAREFL